MSERISMGEMGMGQEEKKKEEKGFMRGMAEKTAKIGAAVVALELFAAGTVEAKENSTKIIDQIAQAAHESNPEADPMTGAQVIDLDKKAAGQNVVGVRKLEQVKGQDGNDYYEDIVIAIGDKTGVDGRVTIVDSRTGEKVPVPADLQKSMEEWRKYSLEIAKKTLQTEGQHGAAVAKLAAELAKSETPPTVASK